MSLQDQINRKLDILEQEIAELRALQAQQVMQNANVIPFPARLRVTDDTPSGAA